MYGVSIITKEASYIKIAITVFNSKLNDGCLLLFRMMHEIEVVVLAMVVSINKIVRCLAVVK